MATKVIRVEDDTYNDAVTLKMQERVRGTREAKALTSSDNSWFSYLLALGIDSYKHNRKMDRQVNE